ncbi:MAG: hypothetical protein IPM91_02425 [Bacteroidetes bacterium]|nr:hypothetical protein [Bacteroidota bacterium]
MDKFGNVICTGNFQNTVDFNPGSGIFNLTSNGADDIFYLKLNGNGAFVWAKNIGGTGIAGGSGRSLKIDNSGNIYTCGEYRGTLDFDPSPNVFNLISNGDFDLFIAKLDLNGNLIWAKGIGGIGNDHCSDLEIDPSGFLYYVGNYIDTVDFNPGIGIYNLNSSFNTAFILKTDLNGNFIWVKDISGGQSWSMQVEIDGKHDLLVCGGFSYTVDFDVNLGVSNYSSQGSSDGFLLKLDANGNFKWVNVVSGIGDDRVNTISIGNQDEIYLAGWFENTLNINSITGVTQLTSVGNKDVFVLKFWIVIILVLQQYLLTVL